MKSKFLALSMCGIIGLSVFALSACTPDAKTYEILVTSSNYNQGGTAHGTGSYRQNSVATLSATPIKDNGFLAWIKDDEQIVSTQKDYSFVVNADTAGKYTALFESSNYEFAKLTNIFYSLSSFKMIDEFIDYGYTAKITAWNLDYNTMPSLYKPLATMGEKTLEEGDNDFEDTIFDDRLFYLDKTYHFQLTINFQYTNTTTKQVINEQLVSVFSVNFANIFNVGNEKKQDISGKTITTYSSPTHTLTMEAKSNTQFELTLDYKNLTSSTKYWNLNENITQQITLVFNYPLTNNP